MERDTASLVTGKKKGGREIGREGGRGESCKESVCGGDEANR